MSIIRINVTSTDKEKISTARQWIKATHVSHKGRTLSPVHVPDDISLTPIEIAEYASAINRILPNERVSDYISNTFITVSKDVFPHLCFNNDFSQPYYMEFEEDTELGTSGWHIMPTVIVQAKKIRI